MPAGAATKMSVSSSKWDETREARPSSHHSRQAAPEASRHASNPHADAAHWPTSSRRPSASHRDSQAQGSGSRHPSASHRDSQNHGSGSKSAMVLVRDKSTGKSLLQRATTGASRTRDSRDPTHEPSRHSSARDHGSRTSSSSRPLEITRGQPSTRMRSQSNGTRPTGPGLNTRLERIEEGMHKMKGEERPAAARSTVVIVQQQAAPQRVYGSEAFLAGYAAAKRGQ